MLAFFTLVLIFTEQYFTLHLHLIVNNTLHLHSIVLFTLVLFTEQYFTLRLHLILLFTLVLILRSSTLLASTHIFYYFLLSTDP
jgi:hypothetical protein